MSLEKAIKNLIDYKMDLDNKINDIALKISSLETYDEIIENAELLLKYAKRANNEISQVFDEAIKVYNDGLSNKTSYVDECNYKNYLNGNNLSVVLTYGVGSTDVVHPKYYTYNINLITGNELSYEEVYTLANISSTNIDSKIESAITSVLKERLKDTKNDLSTCINESIDNYKASVNNNTLKYFLSENNKLNVVVKLSIPAGTGELDTIITVE